jgi:hypothetical protein
MTATYVPLSPPPSLNGSPTSATQGVWLVQGKKANKTFRSALSLHRETANLSEDKAKDDTKIDIESHVSQEAGYHGTTDKR